VDQLGAGRRGVLAQIVLFAQDDAMTAPGQIARDACAVDAAANDKDVKCSGSTVCSGADRAWRLGSDGGLDQEVSSLGPGNEPNPKTGQFVLVRFWAYLFGF
jgi:hypothetical protein